MNEYEVREIVRDEKKPDGCSIIIAIWWLFVFGYFLFSFGNEYKQLKDDVNMLKEKVLDVQK